MNAINSNYSIQNYNTFEDKFQKQQFPLTTRSMVALQRADPLDRDESIALAMDEERYKGDASVMQPESDRQRKLLFQKDIYREANETHNVNLVRQLNDLGMKPVVPSFSGPAIVSSFMDIATKHDVILGFLKKLRQTNRLLTEKEFEPLSDKTWRKKSGLSRILGCDYLAQKIAENQLRHIKVPQKIVVIKDETHLKITGYELDNLYDIDSHEIKIHVKTINQVDRKLSRDEIDELIQVIAAANFTDLNIDNIIVAENGIYFIDTEFKSFSDRIIWRKMGRFDPLINDEDKAYFQDKIKEKVNEPEPESELEAPSYELLSFVLKRLKPDPSNKEFIDVMEKKKLDLEYVGAKKVGHCWTKPNEFSYHLSDILA